MSYSTAHSTQHNTVYVLHTHYRALRTATGLPSALVSASSPHLVHRGLPPRIHLVHVATRDDIVCCEPLCVAVWGSAAVCAVCVQCVCSVCAKGGVCGVWVWSRRKMSEDARALHVCASYRWYTNTNEREGHRHRRRPRASCPCHVYCPGTEHREV
jgi:hypothetical protein